VVIETVASALVGLLGTGLTTYSNYKLKKLEFDHKIALMKAESEAMVIEAKANIQIAKANAQAAVDVEEARAFTASVQANKSLLPSDWLNSLMNQKGWARFLCKPLAVLLLLLMGVIDVLNHSMRPVLTLYSLGIASWVTWKCYNLLPETVSADISMAQWAEAANIVMLLSVTMVTWWFGDRRVAKHLMHIEKK